MGWRGLCLPGSCLPLPVCPLHSSYPNSGNKFQGSSCSQFLICIFLSSWNQPHRPPLSGTDTSHRHTIPRGLGLRLMESLLRASEFRGPVLSPASCRPTAPCPVLELAAASCHYHLYGSSVAPFALFNPPIPA